MTLDISAFKEAFKGDIVTPGDADYKKAIARWAANAERPARIVAFVKDTDDVALALQYARNNNLQVAICCGGHSASGASSVADGVVIDLSRYFNYAVVDPEKRTARVGGGSVWETVDIESIKHGLATVAGTVNHTGVAGLLLGGGYGYLTGQHGLVIDNLVQATIVTADGTALTLSDTENAELFWGIRGGGSNFGVCTEFVLRLHPQRRTVFSGTIVFPTDVMDAVMAELARWWESAKDQEGILQILGRDPTGRDGVFLTLFYNGSEEEGRENFKRFYDLKPVFDGTREYLFEDLNTQTNAAASHGNNYYMKSTFMSRPRPDAVKRVSERLSELNGAPGNQIQHAFAIDYFPYGKVLSVPQNATAHFRFQRQVAGCVLKWVDNSPEAEKAAKSAARELTDIIINAETRVSGANAFTVGYGNLSPEPDVEKAHTTLGHEFDQTNVRALFGPNYERLQHLKARYDPENVFSKWFAIAPAAKLEP